MQPREIDALIDEAIFDRYVCRKLEDIPEGYNTEYLKHFPAYRDGTSVFDCREYTTDIAAAMQVAIELGLLISPTLTGGWGVGLFLGTTGHPDGGRRYCVPGTWTEHRELPIAICLAALKSKGVKVDVQ